MPPPAQSPPQIYHNPSSNTPAQNRSCTQQVPWLVTGASSGIGEEPVTGLLQAGHVVYAGARRVDRMRPMEAAGAHLLSLNVTDDASMTAAQFAVEGLSDCLRMELRQFGIDVVVIQPGAILTECNTIARDGLVKHSGDGAYGVSARAYASFLKTADQGRLPSPPRVVAKTIVKAVQARKPKTRYAIGDGAHITLFLRRILSDRASIPLCCWAQNPGETRHETTLDHHRGRQRRPQLQMVPKPPRFA